MHPNGGEAMMVQGDLSHDMGSNEHDMMQEGPAVQPSRSLTTVTHLTGAFVSLALIAGVGVWGYKLMVRDISGIPVVRAATSDMRVRPEDPGGQLAQHQGLAVNEIAARGVASGPVDQVTLAPPAVALAEEDTPVVVATTEAVVPEAAPLTQIEAAAADAVSAPDLVADFAATVEQRSIDDVVSDVMAEAVPLAEMNGPKVVQVEERVLAGDPALTPQPAVMTAQPVEAMIDAPGVRASVRPQLRPKTRPAVVQQAAFTPQATAEVDAAAIPTGTRLVQLGAFASPEIARMEWDRMQTRFGEILNGKSRVVQKAESSGRTFYRLRAMGFVDLNDTRRFCSVLLAEGADCIPVQVK